jgi:hypothetical protein
MKRWVAILLGALVGLGLARDGAAQQRPSGDEFMPMPRRLDGPFLDDPSQSQPPGDATPPKPNGSSKPSGQSPDTKEPTKPKPPPDPPPRPYPTAGDNGHFTASLGLYFVKPHFDQNPAFLHTATHGATLGGVPTTTLGNDVEEFGYELAVAPRFWLGYVTDCGLGVRAGYFRYEQSARPLDATNPGLTPGGGTVSSITSPLLLGAETGVASLTIFSSKGAALDLPGADSLAFMSKLRLETAQLEITQEMAIGRWAFLLAGGLEYAYLSQNYKAYRSAADGTQDSLFAGHNFEGIGPGVTMEVRRPLGIPGLSLYGSGRGSVLFGRGKHTAMQTTVTVANTISQQAHAARDDLMPKLEGEVGAEWTRDLGHARLVIQSAIVGQAYFGGGNGISENGNLGLVGLQVTAGFHF